MEQPPAGRGAPKLGGDDLYGATVPHNRSGLILTVGVVGMVIIAAAGYFAARMLGLL